ncbi:MAG: hypothetical protein DRH97_00075 [Chloroflexi bacterium]|nr:MAG: hypothetical protein DRH97_00075 [Chloroflexota bacterium]
MSAAAINMLSKEVTNLNRQVDTLINGFARIENETFQPKNKTECISNVRLIIKETRHKLNKKQLGLA